MKTIDPSIYIHDLDRTAMRALKAIPGFSQVMKAFLNAWSERLFYIENMSTNLRINGKQLPDYYEMLKTACRKLGIEVPEMYLSLDVNPNAYTYGDTKPFIVLTSGLIETLPQNLIETVIAHECGHIACHHTLYTTMGKVLCSGLLRATPSIIGLAAYKPVVAALSYWMRCSEFSADRAAMICDGGPEKMMEICARSAGFDKDIPGKLNMDAFLDQASEYKTYVEDTPVNFIMEFIQYWDNDHPLNALRACECKDWNSSEQFEYLMSYIYQEEIGKPCSMLPLCDVSNNYQGKQYRDVITELEEIGFSNIEIARLTNQNDNKKISCGEVVEFSINGLTKVDSVGWYSKDSLIEIAYCHPYSDEEIADQHIGESRIPISSKKCIGKQVKTLKELFDEAGFSDVSTFEQKDLKKGLLVKEGTVIRVSIGADSSFSEDEWISSDTPVRITYRTKQ